MAVAAKTWTAAYGPYVRLRITAQEREVDVPNNRSKVRVTGQIYYPGGTRSSNGYPQTYTVTVNGTQIGKQTSITYNLASGASMNLTTYTSGWISHNSNGAKSVTVRGHITDNAGDTGTISQTYALTTIARASTLNSFSMPTALNWSTANKFNLGITRRSTSFTHDITLRDGSTNIASWTGQGTPSTLTLTAAQVNTLLGRMAGGGSRTMTLRVQTKSGSTNIGSVLTRTATVSASSQARSAVLTSASLPALKTSTGVNLSIGRTIRSSNHYHLVTILDGSTWVWDTGYVKGAPSTSLPVSSSYVNKIMGRMANQTTKTFTVRLRTYTGSGGSGYLAQSTRNITVSIDSSVKPTVEKLSVAIEGNAHAKNNVKRFVQNISKVSGKFTRTATGGASISSSKLEIRRKSGGADLQTINSNSGTFPRVLALSDQYQARGTATDSRGRSSNTGWVDLSNFNVLPYSAPQITTFTTNRRADAETTVDIARYGTVSGLSGDNVITITVQKRVSGTTSWTNVVPVATTYASNFGTTLTSTGNSASSSYEFRFHIVDQFGNSAEQISTVSTQRVVLDVHKNEGVGIGKIHEQGVLDVGGSAYFDGPLSVQDGMKDTIIHNKTNITTISAEGWYRAITIDFADENRAKLAHGFVLKFDIHRMYNTTTNESHSITMTGAHNNASFHAITTYNTQLIRGVRYNQVGATGHIEFFYRTSNRNQVKVSVHSVSAESGDINSITIADDFPRITSTGAAYGSETNISKIEYGMSLLNSHTNYGGGYRGAAYMKDNEGIVHLTGMIRIGSTSSTIAYLPEGYRPTERHVFPVMKSSAIGRIDVTPTGQVQFASPNPSVNEWMSLSGIIFRAYS